MTALNSASALDPRRHAFRPDLADARLRGRVEAERFAQPIERCACGPVTALRRQPDEKAARDTEVLFGERLRVFEICDGWAWVQIATDGYVGYLPADALDLDASPPTHRVLSRSALVYAMSSALAEPMMQLPMNAAVRVVRHAGEFAELAGGGFIGARHLARDGCDFVPDFVVAAESFVGVPYVYGGRSAIGGIDCSGLVQMALAAAGVEAPRDSDMQADEIGRLVGEACETFDDFQRGDLVFWPGHVAIMVTSDTVVHASATNMCVALEPLEQVTARSRKDGPKFRRVRRL